MESLLKALPSLTHSVPVVALAVFGYLMDRFLQHCGNPAFTRQQWMILTGCFVVVILVFLFGFVIPLRSLIAQPPVTQNELPQNQKAGHP